MENSTNNSQTINQQLSGVADTLYIPLVARIAVSKKFPEYFYCQKSLDLEDNIPDVAKKMMQKEYEIIASAARYYNLDKIVLTFISQSKKCNIINLGAGFDTMYHRVKQNLQVSADYKFYELDFPKVIEQRKEVIGEGENDFLIEDNINNLDWAKIIEDPSLPTLMVASGVFQYFHRDEFLLFINKVKEIFPKGEIVFDATDKFGLKMANYFVRRTGNKAATMFFYIKSAKEIAETSNTTLYNHLTFFTDARKILSSKLKISTKILMWLSDKLKKSNIIHLKLNSNCYLYSAKKHQA